MPITPQQLLQILPNAGPRAGVFVPALNAAMDAYDITTPLRVAAFLAQVGHESAQLTTLVENLNYSAQALRSIWPVRFDSALAAALAHQPEQIADVAYASRLGNGPVASGDGWRYRGRGLIQVTGRDNYLACGAGLAVNLVDQPEQLEQPDYAALSAAWFWADNGLNALADAGDFQSITRKINGGLDGQAERLAFYNIALEVLGCS